MHWNTESVLTHLLLIHLKINLQCNSLIYEQHEIVANRIINYLSVLNIIRCLVFGVRCSVFRGYVCIIIIIIIVSSFDCMHAMFHNFCYGFFFLLILLRSE